MSQELFLQKYIDTLVEEMVELSKSKAIVKAQWETEKAVSVSKDDIIRQFQEALAAKEEQIIQIVESNNSLATLMDDKDLELKTAHEKVEERQVKINELSESIVSLKKELIEVNKTNDNQTKMIKDLMSPMPSNPTVSTVEKKVQKKAVSTA